MSASLASVEVGGREYAMVTQPRCKLCCHALRREVEQAIAEGRAYSRIVEDIVTDGSLNERNLRDHMTNQHMPVVAKAVRRVVSEQAEQSLAAVFPMVDSLAGHLTFAQAVVARVQERLEAGDIEPSIRDGVAAAKLLATAHSVAGGEGVEEWRMVYMETLDMVQKVMNPDDWAEFSRRMHQWQRQREVTKR